MFVCFTFVSSVINLIYSKLLGLLHYSCNKVWSQHSYTNYRLCCHFSAVISFNCKLSTHLSMWPILCILFSCNLYCNKVWCYDNYIHTLHALMPSFAILSCSCKFVYLCVAKIFKVVTYSHNKVSCYDYCIHTLISCSVHYFLQP